MSFSLVSCLSSFLFLYLLYLPDLLYLHYIRLKTTIDTTGIFLYNTMMIRKITLLTAFILIALPQSTLAYLSPEDVLLNRELYLPPSAREAQDRSALQAQETAARREREQQRAFEAQKPAPTVDVIDEPLHGAAPQQPSVPEGYIAVPINSTYNGQQVYGSAPNQNSQDAANLELLRTVRLLDRVNQNQNTAQFSTQVLHSGAPDLAPTGAGSVMALIVLFATAFAILRKSRSATALIEVV